MASVPIMWQFAMGVLFEISDLSHLVVSELHLEMDRIKFRLLKKFGLA